MKVNVLDNYALGGRAYVLQVKFTTIIDHHPNRTVHKPMVAHECYYDAVPDTGPLVIPTLSMTRHILYQRLQIHVMFFTTVVPVIYLCVTIASFTNSYMHCYNGHCGYVEDYTSSYNALPDAFRPRMVLSSLPITADLGPYKPITVAANFNEMTSLLIVDNTTSIAWTTYDDDGTASTLIPTVALSKAVRTSVQKCNERIDKLRSSTPAQFWASGAVAVGTFVSIAANYVTAVIVVAKQPQHALGLALQTHSTYGIRLAPGVMGIIAMTVISQLHGSIQSLQPFVKTYRIVTLPPCESDRGEDSATCRLKLATDNPPTPAAMRAGMRIACDGAVASTGIGLIPLLVLSIACLVVFTWYLWDQSRLNGAVNKAALAEQENPTDRR